MARNASISRVDRDETESLTAGIRDAGFDNLHRLRETAAPEDNARALARFLSIPEERALKIARTAHLFSD